MSKIWDKAIVPIFRVAGEAVASGWSKVFKSAAQKEAELAEKVARTQQITKAGLTPQAEAIELARLERAGQQMGTPTKIALSATLAAASTYPLAALDGYLNGRFGDPKASATSQWLTTNIGSGIADVMEFNGNSKSNFISDAFTNGYVIGHTKRYDNASPEERRTDGLVDAYRRVTQLAGTESHQATQASMAERGLDMQARKNTPQLQTASAADAAASAAAAGAEERKQTAALAEQKRQEQIAAQNQRNVQIGLDAMKP